MTDFSTSVLREKFTLQETSGSAEPIIALSNRFGLKLVDSGGRVVETIIVRGQMLHTVVRLAGSILQTFQRTGPIHNRQVPVNWEQLWSNAAGPHEKQFNPNLWIAVYTDGKPIFQDGTHHSFLDVIEQCEARHSRNYEDSLRVAEDMFNKAGHPVNITHDANVAVTFLIGPDHGKCGVILRGARKTTTFSFQAEKSGKGEKTVNPVHFITTAAALLEGIQLAFVIGTGNEKHRQGLIAPYSDDDRLLHSARSRLHEINSSVSTFENMYDVFFRPEKPNFTELVTNAEAVARKRLESVEG
jgi:hypothetical protein